MNENEESTRRLQFLKCLPDLLDKPGKLLYVGGHLRYGRALQMTGLFKDAGWQVDVIEVFPDNILQLNEVRWLNSVIFMDIRNFQSAEKYDCVMLWHGPEHFTKQEIPDLLYGMKSYADCVVFGCPNGKYDQGDEYGNPYERHLSTWYKEDFIKLGMQADEIGIRDSKQGNIIAWFKTE
jgi:hypothetical protein